MVLFPASVPADSPEPEEQQQPAEAGWSASAKEVHADATALARLGPFPSRGSAGVQEGAGRLLVSIGLSADVRASANSWHRSGRRPALSVSTGRQAACCYAAPCATRRPDRTV